MDFVGDSVVKNPSAKAGNMGLIPGSGRSLKEMATHSSILAWKIPWTEEPGRLQSTGCKEPDMTERPHFYLSIFRELVMDRESCCPAVHGVPKSWT